MLLCTLMAPQRQCSILKVAWAPERVIICLPNFTTHCTELPWWRPYVIGGGVCQTNYIFRRHLTARWCLQSVMSFGQHWPYKYLSWECSRWQGCFKSTPGSNSSLFLGLSIWCKPWSKTKITDFFPQHITSYWLEFLYLKTKVPSNHTPSCAKSTVRLRWLATS